MKPAIRRLTWGGTLAALALAVAYLAQDEGSGPGARWPCGANPLRILVEERRRADRLEGQSADALGRIAAMEATAGEVIAGRVTLPEATARFRALARAAPDFSWELFRAGYSGRSDEERHCRQVIAAVRVALRDQPGQGAAIVGRLEAELQEYLERDGTIRLPEPQR